VSFLTKGDPGMNRLIKSILAVAMTLVIVIHCDKQASNPEKKAVQFNFTFLKAGDSVTPSSSAPSPIALRTSSLRKALDLQAFDMVRIMVIDLSAYESWTDFTESETGQEYTTARDAWNGDRGNWWDWKTVWQNYATIVCDQTLEIQGQEAVGTVTGVVGLNSFLAGIFQNGRVRYWYTDQGNIYGEEGETHDISLVFAMEVPPLDPCAAVSKQRSPEEAVYNAAFGE